MSETLSMICYSDIHHHYWQNGLTEADIMELEVDVNDLAKVYGAKAILFGGDAFQAHNPPSSLRHNVDAAVRAQAVGRQVIRLVGNHDRELGSMHSAHAGSHLEWLNTPNKVTVMDQAGHYIFPDLGLSIVAVPAGHGMPRVEARVSSFRLCVFHDILTGSVHDNGVKEAKGVDPAVFDIPGFDLVLGGDNHVPQQIDFQYTRGWYIGAPCQHDWGDSGQERGFIAITLEARQEGVGIVDFNRIPSHSPKFIKKMMAISSLTEVENTYVNDPSLKNNIIKIILQGDAKILSDVQKIQLLEKSIMSSSGARQLKIITEPTVMFKELIPAMKDSKTPEDDWKAYVAAGKLDMTGLDPDTLVEIGLDIIRTSRRA
jgi:DNA repair exonuclease SbcCD nuclease subunit